MNRKIIRMEHIGATAKIFGNDFYCSFGCKVHSSADSGKVVFYIVPALDFDFGGIE